MTARATKNGSATIVAGLCWLLLIPTSLPAQFTDSQADRDALPRVPAGFGITLMAAPSNFRESWWHNRDYGVFVANPFGRAAMRQGAPSTVTAGCGQPFRIRFAAWLHDTAEYQPDAAYEDFLSQLKQWSAND